jgi:CRP-like cAMP-binding protein
MRASRVLNALSAELDPSELQQRVALLQNSEAFSQIGTRELRPLATMFRTENFGDGQIVCRVGDQASEVFVVSSGEFKVLSKDGRQIRRLGRGQVFGEYGLFTQAKRTASVVSAGASVALVLDYQRFRLFLLAFPEASLALLAITVQRLLVTDK